MAAGWAYSVNDAITKENIRYDNQLELITSQFSWNIWIAVIRTAAPVGKRSTVSDLA